MKKRKRNIIKEQYENKKRKEYRETVIKAANELIESTRKGDDILADYDTHPDAINYIIKHKKRLGIKVRLCTEWWFDPFPRADKIYYIKFKNGHVSRVQSPRYGGGGSEQFP